MLNAPHSFRVSANYSGHEIPLRTLDSHWDVVVVGAGVAGATAARLFAGSGRRTLLIDRSPSPRYKVCGSCLNARALSLLAASGLDSRLLLAGALPLREVRIATPNNFATLPVPGGLAVSRSVLDEMLARAAAESGAIFLPRTTAELGVLQTDSRIVCLKQGELRRSIKANLVLAADGLHGGLMQRAVENRMIVTKDSRVGLGAIVNRSGRDFEAGVIYMACGPQGYAGVVRIEGGQLAMAAAADPGELKRWESPGALVASLLHGAGFSSDMARHATWTGTPPLTRRASRFSAPRVLALGDARGYVEPFTGEGMAWAVESAHDALDLVTRHAATSNGDLEQDWEILARRRIARRPMICRAIAATLRSSRATAVLVSMLKVLPGLSGPFISRMNAETRS